MAKHALSIERDNLKPYTDISSTTNTRTRDMSIPFREMISDARRKVIGSRVARAGYRRSRGQAGEKIKGIKNFFDSLVDSAEFADFDGPSPIFVFSAGWRSGSTLMQRLISSADETLIWGEAYDRSCLIQSMVDTLSPFDAEWPRRNYIKQPERLEALSDEWIANLYPPPLALAKAYRSMITELFQEPANRLGARNWGFKEVRFGLAETVLLKRLFTSAKFIFIIRNLEDAYVSYRDFGNRSMSWYVRWPEEPAFTPVAFARHWRRLVTEFPECVQETNGILVKYENLVSDPSEMDRIEDYLGLKIDRKTIDRRLGSSNPKRTKNTSFLEKYLLRLGVR